MPRNVNEAGYALQMEFEQGPRGGPALTPYLCPAGKWTIGYGHTGPDVGPDTPAITSARALELLDKDLDWAEAIVEKAAPDVNANEFAAMASMCFNVGPGDPKRKIDGFLTSSVLRLHNKGDKAGAARAFALWNKATDPKTGKLVELPGLTRRRLREAELYLTPDHAADVQLMPQAVAPPPTMATSKTGWTAATVAVTGAGTLVDQLEPDKVAAAASAVESLSGSAQSVMRVATTVGPIVFAAVIVAGALFILLIGLSLLGAALQA